MSREVFHLCRAQSARQSILLRVRLAPSHGLPGVQPRESTEQQVLWRMWHCPDRCHGAKRIARRCFTVLRQSGSHVRLGNGAMRTTVPVHGKADVKPGTLASIERQTGLKLRQES